ncbi:MAG: VWA domain-containing protein [Prevotella sp.]|nr:VWA domain-containing protein [Prevotella sp.]
MFRFEDPTYLYLLAAIPVLALIRFLMVRQQKKRLRRFGDRELVSQLMPHVSRFRPAVKFWLLLAALALLIVMVARPQFGTKIRHEKRTGIETIIAMDISNSMLAEDVVPSRLDRSKMMVENLVDHFSDDKIGLIVFAGDAFVQLPITSDYVSAKMFLSSINPSMIATQGTDIAAAISMGIHSFTQQEGVGRAIIVITDGEDHEGGALEAAKEAKENGMRVYVLGVGSAKGAPIPTGDGDFMKDQMGQTVMTGLNEEMCRQIAQAGGGAYIHVENNSSAQEQLDSELDKLAKKELAATIYSDYDEQFQAVGIIALLLIILEACLLEVRNPLLRNVSLFKRKAPPHLILLLVMMVMSYLSPLAVSAQTDRQLVRQGNKHFRAGSYADAEVAYRKAIEKNPRNPQANFNLGNSLFAQRKDSSAVAQFDTASKLDSSPLRRAQAYHNMGVVCQGKKRFGEAIEAYKEALRLNPADDESRYNLALCKRQQKEQQEQQQQEQQQQQQKQDQQKKDEQQQQQQEQQEKKEQQQKEQQEKPQMSRENAEQMLNAAIQDEKRTQERMKKAQQKSQKRRLEKNW